MGDENTKIVLNVVGSHKSIIIDLEKLKDAITVQHKMVDEKQGYVKEENKVDLMEGIDIDTITEEEFLEKAIAKIGPINKTPKKTLAKDSFIKIFRFTGEFAKIKAKEVKKHG